MRILFSATSAQTKRTGKHRLSLQWWRQRDAVGLLATGSPVEAEDERVGVVLSGKDLHYHWIQAEAYLQ
jgi:hypothetical protein